MRTVRGSVPEVVIGLAHQVMLPLVAEPDTAGALAPPEEPEEPDELPPLHAETASTAATPTAAAAAIPCPRRLRSRGPDIPAVSSALRWGVRGVVPPENIVIMEILRLSASGYGTDG
jgi:hypothetical protein